ncbi:MAG: S1 RNA-binding domain-containing protein [Lachnospiraceae bacterium]|nr:S1 RNA-binding domain-containing protein [Lachnospiraceae bacterium]
MEEAQTMDELKEELDKSLDKLGEHDVMSGKVENEEQAVNTIAWNRVKEMKDNKETVNVKVGGMVNGGLIAYLEELRAFIPASQISTEYVENLDEYLGKSLDVRVITADMNRKKLVLSAKVILEEKERAAREEAFNSIKVGDIINGKVESLQPYGAFVELKEGVSGLLHISQIANRRLKHPGEVLKEGEEVRVKVTKIADGKISLSKKVLEEPAEDSEEESYKLPESKPLTNSLAGLLDNLKF